MGSKRVCPKADSPNPDEQGVRTCIDTLRGVGATCRNNTVFSDSPLQIGHQWSDQHHLGYFRYTVNLQFQSPFVPISL